MPECEFRQSCDKAFKETGIPCLLPEMGNPDKCELRMMAQGYLNSPQFKKEYARIKECKDFALSEYSRGVDDGWNKANQEFVIEGKATRPEVIELVGETKEHRKQYAKREELVEVIHNTWGTKLKYADEIAEDDSTLPDKKLRAVLELIRTHGLEE